MTSVYVASSFRNKEAVKTAQRRLCAAGIEVTHDWTTKTADHLEPGSEDFFSFLEDCGEDDKRGVARADALLLLAHEDMRDALTEMGIAIGRGIPVVVVDAHRRHSVFYGSTYRAKDLSDAINKLMELKGLRRHAL